MKPSKLQKSNSDSLNLHKSYATRFLLTAGLIILFYFILCISASAQTHFLYHKQTKQTDCMYIFSIYGTDNFYVPVQDRKKIRFIFLPVNNTDRIKEKTSHPGSGMYFFGVV